MKATALLKKQHRKVERIFETIQKGNSNADADVIELANELAAHMAIEQTIFYPAVRQLDRDLVDESYEEHAIAELALKRLLSSTTEDPTFAAKVTALKELILHHVEEEEGALFPMVEGKMDPEELEDLGRQIAMRFDEASAAGYESLLPDGLTASADLVDHEPIATPAPPDFETPLRQTVPEARALGTKPERAGEHAPIGP